MRTCGASRASVDVALTANDAVIQRRNSESSTYGAHAIAPANEVGSVQIVTAPRDPTPGRTPNWALMSVADMRIASSASNVAPSVGSLAEADLVGRSHITQHEQTTRIDGRVGEVEEEAMELTRPLDRRTGTSGK